MADGASLKEEAAEFVVRRSGFEPGPRHSWLTPTRSLAYKQIQGLRGQFVPTLWIKRKIGTRSICRRLLAEGESLPNDLTSIYVQRLNTRIKNCLFDECWCLPERRSGFRGAGGHAAEQGLLVLGELLGCFEWSHSAPVWTGTKTAVSFVYRLIILFLFFIIFIWSIKRAVVNFIFIQ